MTRAHQKLATRGGPNPPGLSLGGKGVPFCEDRHVGQPEPRRLTQLFIIPGFSLVHVGRNDMSLSEYVLQTYVPVRLEAGGAGA
jgi:hypothetical protein